MNAVNQPAHQRAISPAELGAREDITGRWRVARGRRLAKRNSKNSSLALARPGRCRGRDRPRAPRPSVDGKEDHALDAQTSFLDVTVDGRRESPRRHVLEGPPPTSFPQRRMATSRTASSREKSEEVRSRHSMAVYVGGNPIEEDGLGRL